jgi:ABC-type dipeptide/oligopeptide/nickel transport system ATPase component
MTSSKSEPETKQVQTILLIGACGSGKTHTVLAYLRGLQTHKGKLGLNRFELDGTKNVCVLGVYDGSLFQGSDRLSMAVMKDVEALRRWQIGSGTTIVAEGDRFTNSTFIRVMKPTIIKITNNGETGRRARGSNQTQRQIKSIATRVAGIEAHFDVESSDDALNLLKQLTRNHEQD